jgi:SRSO17 transposase
LIRRDDKRKPVSAKQLACGLPTRAWRRVTWREGTNTTLTSRFAAIRIRPAHRDYNRTTPRPEEWCLIDWPKGEPEPTKYWLATLPARTSRRALVDIAKARWRIERDYQDLKQELGLGHYEGRGWRGFQHHATLCIIERAALPPQEKDAPHSSRYLDYPEVIGREAPPIRPERHVSNSIATICRVIAQAIARALIRCPCCQQPRMRYNL